MKAILGYLFFALGIVLLFSSIILMDTTVLSEVIALSIAAIGILITLVGFYCNLKEPGEKDVH